MVNKDEAILNHIKSFLIHETETIAFKIFPRELFIRFFKSDQGLALLSSGFILATRILSFYNITPRSLPILPELSTYHDWSRLDFLLDRALFLIYQIPIPKSINESFYDSILVSFSTFIKRGNQEFTYELSFMSTILSTTFSNRASILISKYLDLSEDTIKNCVFFGIPSALYTIFNNEKNVHVSYLLFN